MTAPSDSRGWLLPSFAIVTGVTVLRWVLLAFNQTDLFVDESQYWLWGQEFAFGYYSKPPLIGWLIGAVTTLAGSDAQFWIRMPGAALHGATALILAALAARIYGTQIAVWVAVTYVTLPMVALGSLLLSTDTVMAPFFAAAIYFYRRLLEDRLTRWAALAGAMAGLAFMAKYAGVYFLLGVGIAALVLPSMRIAWRHAAVMLFGFAVVISPNIIWNLANKLATVSHTLDNVGWVREKQPLAGLDLASVAGFLGGQFAVAGPLVFAALIVAARRPRGHAGLLAFVLPVIAIVSVQALLGKAYANWAASAYFAGTVVAVAVLAVRPKWLVASTTINGAVCVILPLLTLMPQLSLGQAEPLLVRYLGRADLSRQILVAAQEAGNLPIVSDKRDILADLFYTGRESGLMIYAKPPAGRAENHYEQRHPLPPGSSGPVLFVGKPPQGCETLQPEVTFKTTGTWADDLIKGTVIDARCLDVAK